MGVVVRPQERIIVALDCDAEGACDIARKLIGKATWVKVGMTLYYAAGPQIVDALHEMGFKVFLDLKLHDIPHQVYGAAKSAVLAGADMVSVHALGTSAMIEAAVKGAAEASEAMDKPRAQIVAISVLTSMNQESLKEIGIECAVEEEVLRLSALAKSAGADGMVCSPLEASSVRAIFGVEALVVTPGVRLATGALNDQKRAATPAEAFAAGASHVVIGRPITEAPDCGVAFVQMVENAKESA